MCSVSHLLQILPDSGESVVERILKVDQYLVNYGKKTSGQVYFICGLYDDVVLMIY